MVTLVYQRVFQKLNKDLDFDGINKQTIHSPRNITRAISISRCYIQIYPHEIPNIFPLYSYFKTVQISRQSLHIYIYNCC
jgi:hypothetical protein